MALFAHPLRRNWDDQSDYVVHFTNEGNIGAGHNFVGILRGQILEARNRFGIGRHFAPCPRALCLTEAPLHQLKRVADRRSVFGIGFKKSFVLNSGGGPVFYAYRDQGNALLEIMGAEQANADHPIWRAAAFIEQPQPRNSFEWEREWRVPRDLPFGTVHVHFITAPEEEHDDIRTYFADQHAENGFPHYRCPIIDLRWTKERLQREVR